MTSVLQHRNHDRSDVSFVSSNQYSHSLFSLINQVGFYRCKSESGLVTFSPLVDGTSDGCALPANTLTRAAVSESESLPRSSKLASRAAKTCAPRAFRWSASLKNSGWASYSLEKSTTSTFCSRNMS